MTKDVGLVDLCVAKRQLQTINKIAQCINERIGAAISPNPALTPTDVACGKGIGFIPSAVDSASSHMGKVSQEIRKTKKNKGFLDTNWSPMNFEAMADDIDKDDTEFSGSKEQLTKYQKYGSIIRNGRLHQVHFHNVPIHVQNSK